MNKVIVLGRLTQDPEVRYTQSGKAVASFTLAVNRIGNKEADFISCVAWEKIGEMIGNSVSKGQRLLVEGRLQVRTYDANDGTKRRITEIIVQQMEFIEKREGGGSTSQENPFGGQVIPEEEIPF